MNEELNNLIDDILKEKLKLHYENEELEAQGKLIKELCKENEQLHTIIKEVREYLPKIRRSTSYELDEKIDNLEEILDKVKENK